jgi:hypothetical protein
MAKATRLDRGDVEEIFRRFHAANPWETTTATQDMNITGSRKRYKKPEKKTRSEVSPPCFLIRRDAQIRDAPRPSFTYGPVIAKPMEDLKKSDNSSPDILKKPL